MAKQIIAKMERNGMGWTWQYTGDEHTLWGTNDMGEGLFRVDLILNSRAQFEGTCDFSLPTDEKAARRKILRMYHERERALADL